MKFRFLLSLGSNIDPERNLRAAVGLLGRLGQIETVSRVFETQPVGMAPGTAPFLNAAVALTTDLDPAALKTRLRQDVERALGRRSSPEGVWVSRPIDVDIVLGFDATDRAVVDPHPDLATRVHVARPVADLAPDLAPWPDGRTLTGIAGDLEASRPLPVVRPDVILVCGTGTDAEEKT